MRIWQRPLTSWAWISPALTWGQQHLKLLLHMAEVRINWNRWEKCFGKSKLPYEFKVLFSFLWYSSYFHGKTHPTFQTKEVTVEARQSFYQNGRAQILIVKTKPNFLQVQGLKLHADLLQSTASQTSRRYGNISSKNNYFLLWESDVIVTLTVIRADGNQGKYHSPN